MKKVFGYYEVRPVIRTHIKGVGPAVESFTDGAVFEVAFMRAHEDPKRVATPTSGYVLYGRYWDDEASLWLPIPISDFYTEEQAFDLYTSITGLIPHEYHYGPMQPRIDTDAVALLGALLATSQDKPESLGDFVEVVNLWALMFQMRYPLWEETPKEWASQWSNRLFAFFSEMQDVVAKGATE